jgi:hypothetical protein
MDLHQSLEAADQVVVGEAPDVVLERVRNPALTHPDPRLALVLEPGIA